MSSWLLGFGSRGSNTLTFPLDKLSGDELLFGLGLEGILGVLGKQKSERVGFEKSRGRGARDGELPIVIAVRARELGLPIVLR